MKKLSRTGSMRRKLNAALFGLLAVGSTATLAQSGQTVKLLVGYTAGGPVDAGARVFAPYFAKELGMQVVVENKPGAGGSMAGDYVAKSQPNGLTIFFGASPTMTITPHVLKAMPFDPVKDVVPLAPILTYANALVANKDMPFKNVQELVAYAKANPGKVTYGSAGMGASNHLSGELFAVRTGTQLSHVPYKGNAPAMTDVIGGQITMMFDIVSTARNYISSGRVRPIAVTSLARNPSLPDVPTMREAGIADYEVLGWYGLFGPAKTPADIVAKINKAAQAALANEELKRKLIEAGYDLWVGGPQVLGDKAARDLAMWGSVTKNIKFE
ncbi:Bug family tripartite tricarboxylate transporter substrate binding protein [Lacisediminimonas profundi]|uniref:Bug family tripartite tricarboxylate transporter substrate binding protein n=1 Tax=Lacisediminimonas profundi TaxID=2603856 RepID=UPI001F501DB3|nr:tripartite tricarboxylate transporter substrate binding protein [Lacisediminimonas profundi]